MKGVIVQVGEPKSIVLFNNGKIRAIPNPSGCHVGMVVTVKLNNKLKILAFILAGVLLVTLGAFAGAAFPGRAFFTGRSRGGGDGAGQIQAVTVEQVKKLGDDRQVILTGNIAGILGDKKYTFRDSTGDILIEIDREIWKGLSVGVSETVEITGETDIEHGQVIIDVKNIRKLEKD